jgi:hypothetical protein
MNSKNKLLVKQIYQNNLFFAAPFTVASQHIVSRHILWRRTACHRGVMGSCGPQPGYAAPFTGARQSTELRLSPWRGRVRFHPPELANLLSALQLYHRRARMHEFSSFVGAWSGQLQLAMHSPSLHTGRVSFRLRAKLCGRGSIREIG